MKLAVARSIFEFSVGECPVASLGPQIRFSQGEEFGLLTLVNAEDVFSSSQSG